MRCANINLSTRTRMFCAGPANILGEKNLVKSLLISTLDKVIYYEWTFSQGSTKPLFTTQNRVEINWKKLALFPNMLLLA
jgi:hypothetical protein